MIYRICRFICFVAINLLFKLEIHGKENIPKTGAFILASNHISNLDPVVLGVACPRLLNYMAKKELFASPLRNAFFKKLNSFPVKRDSMDIGALKEAIRRIKTGKALLLFPQGKRGVISPDTKVQSGIGFLVSKLNIPVVPAFIKGTEQAMPKGAKFPKPARISIVFGRQIHIEGREMPYEEISKGILENIRHLAVKI